MRRVAWLFGLGSLAGGVAAAALVAGCTAPLDDCSKYAHVGCPGYGGSTSSGSTGDGGTGDGGTGDGDGG
jgi:hypothetical protein